VELLRHLICGRLALASRLAPSAEDTLLGLLVLALAFGGRAASVAEAASVVRKRYETAS
jgi:hypothetical protein